MSFLKRDLRIHLKGPDEKVNVRLKADDGKVADMRVFNISRSGLFLTGESPAAAGSEVEFEISDAEKNDIRGRGRIVWQRNVETPEMPKGAGLLLTALEKSSRPLWQSLLGQYLNQVSAHQLMDKRFVEVAEQRKISEIARSMQKLNCDLAVVKQGEKFFYITAKEILFALSDGSVKSLQEITLKECLSVSPEVTPMLLLQIIRHSEVQYTFITDKNQVLGFIRNANLLPYLAEFMELERERLEQGVMRATSRIVHDLQTPLSIISASNHLLLGGSWDAAEYIKAGMPKSINENCGYVTSLLSDLMKITSENLDSENLNLQKFDLVELCKDTIASFKVLLANKNQSIDFKTLQKDIFVELDRLKTIRVLHNLISNAMKYSDEKSVITVGLEVEERAVLLRIQDQGQGIKAADLPYIFEEFNRGSLVQEKQSYGLGLAIVSRIIKASGGVIAVSSNPGQGTTFTVKLPKV